MIMTNSLKKIEFTIPGRPVPYTRVTRKQISTGHTTRQYKRYVIYKCITALSFLDALNSHYGQKSSVMVNLTGPMCTRALRMGLIKSLTTTINKTSHLNEHVYVRIQEEIDNEIQ